MFRAQQWNPMIWLNWWYKVTHTRNGDTRIPRAKVFQNNLDIFRDGAYRTGSGSVVTLPVYGRAVDDAVMFREQITLPEKQGECSPNVISVVNRDCVVAAQSLLQEGLHPALLNMASLHHPGGGVIDGSGAQEEIRTILNIGIINGHDSLVLGAFGCGAYCTPPDGMARLFREVMSEDTYSGRFRKIVFAIIDDGNSFRHMNSHGNFAPFKKEFNTNSTI